MTLAMLSSPAQWLVLVALLLILAPGLIPPMARVLGRLVRVLMGTRRLRVEGPAGRPAGHRVRLPVAEGEAARSDGAGSPLVGILVAVAIAVLSWWLLRSR